MSIKANSTTTTKFLDLWPVPSAPPFPSSPTRVAGATPEATQKLRDLLKLNHENWHIFYDAVGRHDHITHHLIALWSIGAAAKVLQAAYDLHVVLQVPVGGEKAERITKENVFDHLGDRTYYKAYTDFFTEVVREQGPVAAFEEYVFSDKANFESTNKDGKHPEMLNRFHGGLLHAIIHLGYGVEFGIPGMVVEGSVFWGRENMDAELLLGLAQTAVNEAGNSAMIPPSLFVQPDAVNGAPSPAKDNVHAFTVLGRVLKDERFGIKFEDFRSAFIRIIMKCGGGCANYAADWLPDMHPSPELVQQKIQELEWAATVMSVVPGFEEGKEYNADFIGMHFVTSSVFLGSLVPSLEPRSQALLLRAYFAVLIAVWALLGRPQLNFESFFATSATFKGPHHVPAPTKFALAPSTNPNPWLDIIHQALVHPDDHVPKYHRVMHHYALKYGSVHAGYFANTELPGADKIDGTLFVKGATLAAQRVAQEVDELPDQMSFWDRRTYRRELTENVY